MPPRTLLLALAAAAAAPAATAREGAPRLYWYGQPGRAPLGVGCTGQPGPRPLNGSWVPLHFVALRAGEYVVLGLRPAQPDALAAAAVAAPPLRPDVMHSTDGGRSWRCMYGELGRHAWAPVAGAAVFVTGSVNGTVAGASHRALCVAGGRPLEATPREDWNATDGSSPGPERSYAYGPASAAVACLRFVVAAGGGGVSTPGNAWEGGAPLPAPVVGATPLRLPGAAPGGIGGAADHHLLLGGHRVLPVVGGGGGGAGGGASLTLALFETLTGGGSSVGRVLPVDWVELPLSVADGAAALLTPRVRPVAAYVPRARSVLLGGGGVDLSGQLTTAKFLGELVPHAPDFDVEAGTPPVAQQTDSLQLVQHAPPGGEGPGAGGDLLPLPPPGADAVLNYSWLGGRSRFFRLPASGQFVDVTGVPTVAAWTRLQLPEPRPRASTASAYALLHTRAPDDGPLGSGGSPQDDVASLVVGGNVYSVGVTAPPSSTPPLFSRRAEHFVSGFTGDGGAEWLLGRDERDGVGGGGDGNASLPGSGLWTPGSGSSGAGDGGQSPRPLASVTRSASRSPARSMTPSRAGSRAAAPSLAPRAQPLRPAAGGRRRQLRWLPPAGSRRVLQVGGADRDDPSVAPRVLAGAAPGIGQGGAPPPLPPDALVQPPARTDEGPASLLALVAEPPGGDAAAPSNGSGWVAASRDTVVAVDGVTGQIFLGGPLPCAQPSCGPGFFATQCVASPFDAVCERCNHCSRVRDKEPFFIEFTCLTVAHPACAPCVPCDPPARQREACGQPGAGNRTHDLCEERNGGGGDDDDGGGGGQDDDVDDGGRRPEELEPPLTDSSGGGASSVQLQRALAELLVVALGILGSLAVLALTAAELLSCQRRRLQRAKAAVVLRPGGGVGSDPVACDDTDASRRLGSGVAHGGSVLVRAASLALSWHGALMTTLRAMGSVVSTLAIIAVALSACGMPGTAAAFYALLLLRVVLVAAAWWRLRWLLAWAARAAAPAAAGGVAVWRGKVEPYSSSGSRRLATASAARDEDGAGVVVALPLPLLRRQPAGASDARGGSGGSSGGSSSVGSGASARSAGRLEPAAAAAAAGGAALRSSAVALAFLRPAFLLDEVVVSATGSCPDAGSPAAVAALQRRAAQWLVAAHAVLVDAPLLLLAALTAARLLARYGAAHVDASGVPASARVLARNACIAAVLQAVVLLDTAVRLLLLRGRCAVAVRGGASHIAAASAAALPPTQAGSPAAADGDGAFAATGPLAPRLTPAQGPATSVSASSRSASELRKPHAAEPRATPLLASAATAATALQPSRAPSPPPHPAAGDHPHSDASSGAEGTDSPVSGEGLDGAHGGDERLGQVGSSSSSSSSSGSSTRSSGGERAWPPRGAAGAEDSDAAASADVSAALARLWMSAQTPAAHRLAGMRIFFRANPHLLSEATDAVAQPAGLPARWLSILHDVETRGQLIHVPPLPPPEAAAGAWCGGDDSREDAVAAGEPR